MPLLSKVQRGQPITAELFNTMIDAIRECQLQSVIGGTFKRTTGGTTIAINSQQSMAGSTFSLTYPFEYYAGGTASAPWFGLRAGTVNGVLPTNWTTTFALPVATTAGYTKYIDLKCDGDGKVINSVEIQLNDSPPSPVAATPELAPSTFKINTHVIINGEPYRTIGASSILAMIQESVRVDKEYVPYGVTPWIQYYVWGFVS